MIQILLKLIGTVVIVVWWIVAGFFKKILDTFKLIARIKRIFEDKNENRKGGES